MKTAHASIAALVFSLAACGPNNAALIGSEMEGETELGSTADALTSNKTEVWFPMQEGNAWTLESPTTGEVRTLSYEAVEGGIGWLNGLIGEGAWMGTPHNAINSLYAWNEDAAAWSPFIRFGYAQTSWTWGTGACSTYVVKRIGTGGTMKTPAGTFTDTRTIGFNMKPAPYARCMPPKFNELTFAPGVGLIAMANYNDKFFLTSAKVKGKAIPAVIGTIKGSLKLDQAVYENKSNTIVCITTPCPGNDVTAVAKATYTVTNHTSRSETYQFSSGCQFNLWIVDSGGKTVKSLAEDRFCTMALTSFTLAPGQSKVFATDISLADRGGMQMGGNYTMKAALTPRTTQSPAESAASFIVNVSPAIP